MEGARRVVVVGQGYVGLPLAMRAVEVGHDVVGFDVDPSRIDRLAAGEPFIEDVPAPVLEHALKSGRYRPSTDPASCAGFDVAVITVPTPLRDGAPDLSYVEAAGTTLARFVRPGATVVLESTTYPGTTQELLCPLLEAGSGLVAGVNFALGYSPERIDPGNPVWGLANTPKVVSGVTAACLEAVEAFYATIVERTVPVATPKEAELTKLLENTFRHVNIALVNELAMLASELDVDVWQAVDAAATKPFGFMGFTPGPGVGGHCLPIDPSYLSWRVKRSLGRSFRFVELANEVNDHMPDHVVHRIVLGLNRRRRSAHGARVLVLGLAYKRNTGDARQSPALAIVDQLLALGAEVRAADPHVLACSVDGRVTRVDADPDELAAADAVVVVTDHDRFDYDGIARHARYVFDTRRRVPASPNVERL